MSNEAEIEGKQTETLQAAIYRIAAAAKTTKSLDQFYPQIHRIISSVIPADNFYIALYDPARGLLRFPYFKDIKDEPFVRGFQPGKGLTAYVLRTGKSLLCTQALHNELERRGEVKLLGAPSAIWLGVPLIVEGTTIGAMVVQHYSDPKAYGEREQHLLEFVSTQVGIVMERKRAQDSLGERRKELQTLYGLAQLIERDDLPLTDLYQESANILPLGWQYPEIACARIVAGDREFRTADYAECRWAQSALLVVRGSAIGKVEVGYLEQRPESDEGPFLKEERDLINAIAERLSRVTERKSAEQALLQSEAELRALFASMHDVVLVIDHDGVYRKIAPTNPELLVKPPEELLGRNLQDVFPLEQAETFIRTVQQVLNTKQAAQIEYDLIIGDQTIRFETSISPMTEDSTLWVAHDITRRKHIELVQNAIFRITQAAITSDRIDILYHSIHSILGELIPAENFYIALYDPIKGMISFPYYIDQYDEPPTGMTEVRGLTGHVIRTGRPLLATREIFDRLVQQGEVEPWGTASVDWMGAPLKVEGRIIGVMAVQSYTEGIHFNQEDLNLLEFVSTQVAQAIERKRMEEEISDLALTDELTGIYNRRGFTLLAEQEMKVANRLKKCMLLIFCDVDGLKVINDGNGHAEGDLALKEVSAILKQTFREADIAGRIGGDEFVVLAVDAALESEEPLINRIRNELDRRNQQGDRPYQLTFSVGIARYDPAAPCTVSELIAQADGLMYQQKQGKKKEK